MICAGLVVVECLAAVLFVTDFFQEQVESITTNSTLIETYQRTHGERGTFTDHFRVVFGSNWLWWPWPVATADLPDYSELAHPDDANGFEGADGGDGGNLDIAGEESESYVNSHPSVISNGAGVRHRYGDPGLARTANDY